MYNHNVFNTTEGVFVFGSNNYGQLGLGDNKERLVPTKLEFFSDIEIISIHCGGYHTIINTTNGLFVFGYNHHGQLGLGDRKDRITPTKFIFKHKIISISCGNNYTIINATDGLFVFGFNDRGQLGLGDTEDRLLPTKLELFQRVSGSPEIISTHCGRNYTIINTTIGLFVFGSNYHGQLGLGDTKNRITPTKLDFLIQPSTVLLDTIQSSESESLEIISIHCGAFHTIINTTDGLFVFGWNGFGQLGLGGTTDRKMPTKLELGCSLGRVLEIISIHCGSFHTIINTTDGVFVFGDNIYGQLGLGDSKNRLAPTKLKFESLIDLGCNLGRSLEIISIHCGNAHTIINTTDGLVVFGWNGFGQLGLGDTEKREYPTNLNLKYEMILSNNKKQIKSALSKCI